MTATAYCELPATPMMEGVGLSFGSLVEYAKKAVHLLQTVGEDAVAVVEIGFRAWQAISNRDLTAILAAFSEAQGRIQAIIAAIQAEFGD